jgi:hypothetical protein
MRSRTTPRRPRCCPGTNCVGVRVSAPLLPPCPSHCGCWKAGRSRSRFMRRSRRHSSARTGLAAGRSSSFRSGALRRPRAPRRRATAAAGVLALLPRCVHRWQPSIPALTSATRAPRRRATAAAGMRALRPRLVLGAVRFYACAPPPHNSRTRRVQGPGRESLIF